MAERLGMDAYLDKPCGQLSMGQQQRIAVVRALCQPFRYLFLDEPTSHLDRDNTKKVMELVMEQAEQQKAAVIITGLDQDYHLPESFEQLTI
jgi:putative ABC transport system ATP-binding protein